MDEIFIPRKFKEKIAPKNTEEQKKISNQNLMKLKGEIEILENSNIQHN